MKANLSRCAVIVPGLLVLALLWAPATVGAGDNRWTSNGPPRTVNTVLVDSTFVGVHWLYAGTTSGLYRSTDAGLHWAAVADSLPTHNILSLTVASGAVPRLYAGTHLGLYASTDAGANWTPAPAVGGGIMALATSVTAQHTLIYAGTFGRGVYVSEDDGASWRRSDDLIDAIVYALEPSSQDAATIYAGTARGLYVSRDAGVTWRAVGVDIRAMSVRAVHISSSDPGVLVVATYGNGVWRSDDGGTSWRSANGSALPAQVRDLVVDDTDTDLMYAATATSGYFRTRNGGRTWTPMNLGLTQLTSRSLRLLAGDRLLGTGSGMGVWQISFNAEPRIKVTPTFIDFGPVPMTRPLTRRLQIDNTGARELEVTEVSLGGSAGFSLDFAAPLVVAPGRSRVVQVTFDPPIIDFTVRDTVRIKSSDPSGNVIIVPITGRGAQSRLSARPRHIDFGAVRIPPGHADAVVTLTNEGSAPLTLRDVVIESESFSVLAFVPGVLNPGRATGIRVAFDPLLPRYSTGDLLIVTDSVPPTPGANAVPETLKVGLEGTGTAPDIRVSTSVLDFGRVDLGTESALDLEILNTGTADLTVSRLLARGDQFFIDRTFGVPRDTSFAVLDDTILVVSGLDTTVAFGNSDSTIVEVRGDTTRLIANGDTSVVVTRTDSTLIIVGDRTVFTATTDSTVIGPGSRFPLTVTYRPTVSGSVRDTIDIASDAGFGLVNVVLRGTGNALSLEPMVAVAVGVHPVDMAVGALDQVAGADLALADSLAGRVHVLHNDGSGGFPPGGRTTYPTAASAYGRWSAPVAVAMAPIYGTANDLIVGDRVARSISLLANDGNGVFDGAREDIFIGHHLADVLAADLDTDGDVDIAVANGPEPTSDSITLLYNDGQGGLSARAVLAVGDGPVALAADHLNADGHIDLVVVNRTAGSVSVLLNDGDGSFTTAATHAVGDTPFDVVLSDYDADGDNDIAVAVAGGTPGLRLFLNDSDGGFSPATSPQSTGLRAYAVAANGMTADVLNDLVAGGAGNFLVFYENRDGVLFERQEVEIGFPVRDLHLVSLDDNQVADVVLLSADSARVQVLRNRLASGEVRPRPPTAVTAADVGRDLGGRIRVTWVDGDYGSRPLADQVIATTEYIIERSETADFEVAESLGVVPGGILSFVDGTATPYETFFYHVLARRGELLSAPSTTVGATSIPAPLFDLRLSNAPKVSRGDTLRVQIYLTPAEHRLAGMSVYLTFEPAQLQLLPNPSDSTGNTPFRVDAGILGSFAPIINGYHHDVSETGKLDLSLLSPGGTAYLGTGVAPVLLAELWFLANKEASTFLTLDDEVAANRRTAVVEDGTGQWIEPVLGDTTRLTVRDVFVSGAMRLEQRAPDSVGEDQVTLLLVNAAGDTLESPLNDEDRLRPGIQVRMANDGRFALDQIPSATYRVYAKVRTHLQGVAVGDLSGTAITDTATVDSARRHLTFHWVAPDTTFVDSLPGGDANNDNRINLADFGVFVRYYTQSTAAARQADFDGDGRVDLDDFWLLAQNFGRVGMEVVGGAAARPVARPGSIWLADGALHGAGLGGLRGLTLRLPEGVTASTAGSVFEGHGTELFTWPVPEGRRIAVALTGDAAVAGDGVLLRLRGEGQVSSLLAGIELLDAHGAVFHPGASAAPRQASALQPNYPNPFNPTTTIPFDIAAAGSVPVRLEVFDVLGQRVRLLVDEPALAAGRYTVTWDGLDEASAASASGFYYTRLQAGAMHDSRRLLLLR